LEKFSQHFEYARTGRGLRVRFPEVIRPYVTKSVLVESYERATPLQALLSADENGDALCKADCALEGTSLCEIRERVGKLCMDSFLKMLFAHNFVHADMHPGNILVSFPDGVSKPEIVVLDAGLAVKMCPSDRRNFVSVFEALAMRDGQRAGQLMIERTPGDRSFIIDEAGFVTGMTDLIGRFFHSGGLTLSAVRIGDGLGQLMGLACRHRVRLQTSFVTVVTSIMVLEGVSRQLNPFNDLLAAATPLIIEAARDRFSNSWTPVCA